MLRTQNYVYLISQRNDAEKLVHAFITSRLACCNSFPFGCQNDFFWAARVQTGICNHPNRLPLCWHNLGLSKSLKGEWVATSPAVGVSVKAQEGEVIRPELLHPEIHIQYSSSSLRQEHLWNHSKHYLSQYPPMEIQYYFLNTVQIF